jgi:hypothetical protein
MDARLIGSDSAHGAESSTDDRRIQAMRRAALAALLVLLACAAPAAAQMTVRPGGAELTEPESYDRPPPGR